MPSDSSALPPFRRSVGVALGAAIVLWAIGVAGETHAFPGPGTGGPSRTDSSVPEIRVVGSDVEPSENWRWWDGFSLPVLDGRVRALTVFRGDLIAAGALRWPAGGG